jgi:uncharacterized protein YjbI with pentapeptide repeats
MSSFQWRVGEIIKEDAALAAAPSQDLPARQVGQPELVELLQLHREWVESRGIFGKRLELARANFEGMDLTGANLQGAILNKANFQRAELLLADLRGASLVQADLRESNLLGADFKGANLEGASIDGAAGLHTKQLAGASLLWAVLPSSISEFEGQHLAEQRARQCYRLFIATMVACALSCLRIATTRDVLFLRDAPLIPIPKLGAALPISGFYVVAPMVIFGLFLYLHVSMERLWERLIELPAIFPDGRPVDRSGSWLLMTLFRRRFHGWTGNQVSPSMLESTIPLLLAYIAVPATLLMFWARYLVMQDLRAAMLQIVVFVLALVVTTALPKKDLIETLPSMYSAPIHDDSALLPPADRVHASDEAHTSADDEEELEDDLQSPLFAEMQGEIHEDGASVETLTTREVTESSPERLPSIEISLKSAGRYATPLRRAGFAAALGAALAILTLGIVYGAPHDSSVMPDYGAASMRRWSSDAFWMIGYSPYAVLTESAVSTVPAGWTGRDEDISHVKGAQLNDLHLRYAQGYRTFWTNSHLWKADLQGAYFSESDFRGANLREANLRSASFDRVQFFRANLQGARLEKANLTRADLRETDLSYAEMHGAIAVDARLGGANLFNADLREARLAHANFERADLREANLSSADLSLADLQDAYLWSTKLPSASLRDAQLNRAILIEADLRNSDLRGANFGNAVLRGADFTGANLAGADFRSASGLTATQLCSAGDRREAQFDDAIITQVEAQCSTTQPSSAPSQSSNTLP